MELEDLCLLQGFAQEHSAQLLSELPTRWEKLGDLTLLPRTCMASPDWGSLGQLLWRAVAGALGVERLAMQAPVANTGHCSTIPSALAYISSVDLKLGLCGAACGCVFSILLSTTCGIVRFTCCCISTRVQCSKNLPGQLDANFTFYLKPCFY